METLYSIKSRQLENGEWEVWLEGNEHIKCFGLTKAIAVGLLMQWICEDEKSVLELVTPEP